LSDLELVEGVDEDWAARVPAVEEVLLVLREAFAVEGLALR